MQTRLEKEKQWHEDYFARRQNSARVPTAVLRAGEDLPLPSQSFDVVFGNEVLHHLTDALGAASLELRRVLKPDGLAVFSEPVLRSKLIAGLRKVFPKNDEITEDERQLNDADFAKFLEAFDCRIENLDILSRLSKLLSRGPLESAPRAIAWISFYAMPRGPFRCRNARFGLCLAATINRLRE
jgi:SAM-dependent methyltransferase